MLAVNVLDARSLLGSFGTVGLAIVLFAETGLLIGLFLPGDSLLFTAGLLSATSAKASTHLHLGWVLVAVAAGALIGAQTGYLLGRAAGPKLISMGRPRVVAANLRTRQFVERYGVGRAIVLGRFVPVVRTMISPLLGALEVPARTLTLWQVTGGLVWSLGVTLAGWALGSRIHNIDHYVLPIVLVIVVLSLIPIALEIRSSRRNTHNTNRPHATEA